MSTPAVESREVAGRYRLERLLGRGGMGSVHLARDLKLSTYVAVKLAQAAGVGEETFRARFAREARIGNHLGRHEGFVRAFDWGEAADGRQLYLAMDLVADGRPLDLRPGRPLASKLGALASAARLVVRAHALGVVHRDLKPGNLLETPDGQVFLADFGLARLMGPDEGEAAEQDAVTGPGQPLGTPAYMPPEQFEDGHGVDARADVYALGVMLFQALTGRLPFEGRAQEAQRAVLAGAARAPRPRDLAPEVPQALDVLCAQALALDRERRVASAEVFLRGLVAAGGLASPAGAASGLEGVAPGSVGHLELELTHASRVCFAMDHCGVPLVEVVRVVNDTWAPIEHAQLRLELAPDLGAATTIQLPTLLPGDVHELDHVPLRPAAERLRRLEERERAQLRWTLESGAHVHARGEADVEVLAANEWPGEGAPPQLLAVFVTPNHPVIGRVLARVRDRLVAAGAVDPSLTGYEDRSPGLKGRVRATVCALYETLQALGITYAPAPASFERDGQKVRFADAILRDRLGNCLDLTLLFAACLEQMGLHALLVLIEGHAVPGVWLQDDPVGLQGGLAEDAARVRNLRALDHVLLVDVTAAASSGEGPARSFDQALLLGDRALEDDARFRVALDVHALRDPRYGFRPLPLRALAALDDAGDAPAGGAGPPVDEVRRILAEAAQEVAGAGDAPPPRVAAPPRTIAVTPARFRRWQDRLLDLTLRNKLLAFSLKGRAALPLEVSDLAAFEDRLAASEAFDLVPRPEPLEGAVAVKPDPAQLRAARAAELARGRLQVGMLADDLVARGRHLVSEARTGLEEGGATTLYVAVGLLRWIDEEGDERLAPLVLYPARLELDRRRRTLRLRRIDDEDPVGNVTLREKVRRDHGLDLSILDALPHDDQGVDVAALLATVREAIRPLPRWEVLEEAHVGLFTFTKFLMWRDLRDHQDALLESDVVSRIASTKTTPSEAAIEGLAPEQLDAKVDPATLPLVVDADATQTSAIVSALRGRSFVLQGPPGTGKSQTITNLIAAMLAAGKTVLFVSEKMAALEVVHRRLEAVGLGDFCLELHSHKTSKKEVLASLRLALDRAERQAAVPWAERSRELGKLRDDLNAYVRALHAPRPSGFSFHEGRSRLLELSGAKTLRLERGAAAPGAKLAGRALEVSADELQAMLEATSALAERARVVGAPGEHPFRESELVEWSEAAQRALREAAEDLLPALDAVDAASLALVEAPAPLSTAALAAVASLAATVAARPCPPTLQRDDAVARAIVTEVERHAAALDAHAARRARLAVRWTDALYQADLAGLSARFASYQASWSLTRWLMLGSGRAALRPCARGELPADDVVARDLAEALALSGDAPSLAEGSQGIASRLDRAWEEKDGAAGLRAVLAHARAMQAGRARVLAAAPGLEPVVDALGADALGATRRVDLRAAADALHAALVALERAETAARTAAAVPAPDGRRWPRAAQAEHRGRLRETAGRWLAGLRRLREWCFYREAVAAAAALDLSFLVTQHAQGTLGPDELGPAFERWLLERWVEAARDQEPALRRFDGPEHHRRVEAFAQRDTAHLELARRFVVASLEARLPTPAAVVAETSELGRLRREIKKQRGHMAVRQLLRELPELLPRLKACMLMSPLSVAQYLPADGRRFDLVVFDEASQIPTHEAIGAMARGDQVVVVGDSRQLPPTTFFQRAPDEQEAEVEDEAELSELESVLDEAVASQLPEQTLGWHYRSRHESLIEFSNRHYYDERLTIFPAARAAADVGVRWHPVPEGVYGGSDERTNRAEAEALVAHLVASLRATPVGARSFGVVTFNRPQQELIEALLDEARARHPELEAHFASDVSEPVFVKNLENVQGDERDEVLFSVTYARDAAGRLRMHFGPLSIAGGERRLNVAITRARRQLHVFSTLTADQIDLSRTRAKGTEHLRLFLEFAARRGAAPEALAGAPGDGIKGALERDVHAALVELGYGVRPWVGCGRSRIDLGVVNPQRPDEYLLGVECDGAAYDATPTARDRDRLRRQVLAGLGWRMHRVWLLDWCEDRAREVERLKVALAAAVEDAARRAADEVARAAAITSPPVDDPPPDEAASAGDATTGALSPPMPSAAPTVQAPQAAYVLAPARVVSATPDDLLRPKALRALYDRIEEVVRAEGPVHVDLLVRRVLDAWSWPRVTPRAKARVLTEGVETLRHAGKVDVRGEWVWCPARTLDVFRTGGERKAEHLPPEEVAVAARWLLEQNVALGRDDLARETAKVLGFPRMGEKIAEAMRAGIARLAADERCVIDGERVRLA